MDSWPKLNENIGYTIILYSLIEYITISYNMIIALKIVHIV